MKNVLFKTTWPNGNHSVNDRIIIYCKENNIKTRTNNHWQNEILINDRWVLTDYKYDSKNDILTIFEKVN